MGIADAPPATAGLSWKNYLGEQAFMPSLSFSPVSEDEVAAVVRRAVAAGARVHCAGRGHASSPIVRCDGYLIRSDKLTGARRVAADELGPGAGGHYVRVLAGTRISDLSRLLGEMGLAMRNLGSAAFQSIAGAIATGTHGSGASLGALADLVRSVDLVDGHGARLRIEPSRGFTRANRVPRGVRLIANDDLFHSVVVGVGVAGLVTSMVLDVRPAFVLSETRERRTWEELYASDAVDAEILAAEHFEMWLNPYACDGAHTAIVTKRVTVGASTPRNPRKDPWALRYRVLRVALTVALDLIPAIVPRALDWALKSQVTTKPWVDASERIFDLGAVNAMPALATEWVFPMARWKDAVDALLEEARRLSLRPRAVGGVPFGVRFVRASPHFLAMSHGAPGEVFCTVELPVYDNEHDRATLLAGYERAAERHGGRPHWGQAHRGRPLALPRRYPKMAAWREARREVDPDERFANFASLGDGLTRGRVGHPVVDDALAYYDTVPPREVLVVDPAKKVHIDRRRFLVHAPAAKFVDAFQDALLQPGVLVARRFEVLRLPDRVSRRFELGERFQGRFALDKQLLEDTLPHPAWWTKILRFLEVDKLLQHVENDALSNYGEVRELLLDPPADEPYSIRYVYLTGTPFAGESHFTVEPVGEKTCRYTEQLTFQPLNEIDALSMQLLGLRLHNKVVFGQVEAGADLLGVRYDALDPDDTGHPNVQ